MCLETCFIPSLEVTEKVQVFVMDVNDEKPQFQNLPAILDVREVSWQL